MKPIWLTMSAFGSYAKEETVDFSKMDQGIFLITGDTGAGKTTIFDGIVYALYDRTSGGVRDGNMMRSEYADLCTPTFVELCFSCREEQYRIRRNPDYERESSRKDKDGNRKKTQEKSKVELFLPDGSAFRGNKKEVNKKIEELLGMDARQFMQMAMIAQGDFLKLLLARSEERKEIFSRLFDTGIFGNMQEELRKREKEIYEKLKEKENALKEQTGGILYPKDWEHQEKFTELKEKAAIEEILDYLENLIKKDQEREKDIDTERKRIQNEILETIKIQNLTENILEIQTRLSSQEEWFQTHTSQEEKLKEKCIILEKRVEEAENRYRSLEKDWEKEKRSYEEKKESWNKRIQELALLERLSKELTEKEFLQKRKAIDWEKANLSYRRARESYEQIYEIYFREQAGILAQTLKSGEPCPVCGSRIHPMPAKKASQAPDESQVKKARENTKKLEELREKAGEIYQSSVQMTSTTLAGLNQEGIRLMGEEFDGSKEFWRECIKNESLKAINEDKIRNKKLEEIRKQWEECKKNIALEKENIKSDLEKAKLDLDEFVRKCERVQGEHEADKKRFQNLKLQWKKISKHAFESKKIREMAQDYEQQNLKLKEQEVTLEEIHREYYSRLQLNQRILETLKKYLKEYERWKEEYAVFHNLSQTAGGTLPGNIKIDFESYVQRRYFQKVIQRANVRLMQMTAGQFLLKCKEFQRMSGRGKAGLDLDVYSLVTDSTRDVKTLSGGESFMAALAMALGLADVVSDSLGAVRLDTMFIDEGFGSLDEHAREQAVRVLYELSGQSRLIGIISHVAELKEQIEQKLYVKKGKNGSHAYWIE